MKTNGQMNRGGKLEPEYREALACYYLRFVEEYENVDGQIAVAVLNRSDKNFKFSVRYEGLNAVAESPAHSISTFRFLAG